MFEVKVMSLPNSRRPSRDDVYIISFVTAIILLFQKSQDIRQAVYPRGFHVMKAYGGVVVKCNVLSTFAQHDLFVSLGTVVSDLYYGFQGQKSVLVLCQGLQSEAFYRMQTKACGESSFGRLHYFTDYDFSW